MATLTLIQENYFDLKNNEEYVKVVRELGRQKAEYIASQNIEKIKEAIGI